MSPLKRMLSLYHSPNCPPLTDYYIIYNNGDAHHRAVVDWSTFPLLKCCKATGLSLCARSITVLRGSLSGEAGEPGGCRGGGEGEDGRGAQIAANTEFSIQPKFPTVRVEYWSQLFPPLSICLCSMLMCNYSSAPLSSFWGVYFNFFFGRTAAFILPIMLRKSSGGDREVLLDLDYGGREAQMAESYGSLQNGSFIPPRCVSTAFTPL